MDTQMVGVRIVSAIQDGEASDVLKQALLAVVAIHSPETLRAGVSKGELGVPGHHIPAGECAYCGNDFRPLIREYRGYLNGQGYKVKMHEHVNDDPWCTACEDYDSCMPWPCPTVTAITETLGVELT